MKTPQNFSPDQIDDFVDRLIPWVHQQTQLIMEQGQGLSPEEIEWIDRLGIPVSVPGDVRILEVDTIPLPENEQIMDLARQAGMTSDSLLGMTLGKGIYVRMGHRENTELIIHELTHVAQWERFGKNEFLKRYLSERLNRSQGGTLEREAHAFQENFKRINEG